MPSIATLHCSNDASRCRDTRGDMVDRERGEEGERGERACRRQLDDARISDSVAASTSPLKTHVRPSYSSAVTIITENSEKMKKMIITAPQGTDSSHPSCWCTAWRRVHVSGM